ncbi:MAG: NADH-quinone oxidoreductase subunit [Actinomycetota bacterium]|nr:NADH-quinone oxidoreductase subunit [Actinomycetota bacterium]
MSAALLAAVQPNSITPPDVDWLGIAPVIALAGAGVLIVLLRALLRTRPVVEPVTMVVAFAGTITAGAMLAWQWSHIRDHGAILTLATMVRVDAFAVFLGILVTAALFLALLLSVSYIRPEGLEVPEYLAMLLLSAAAMVIMTTSNNLIVVFVALEALSIPLYVLVAFDRRRLASQEAGIKYFVLGSFASAIFLYGVALVYGATGSTSLTGIAQFLAANTLYENGTLLAGMAMLVVGLGFKVSAVPFHMWTPDVYQGAPSPITAFMSSATKVAGFAAFLRIFLVAFPIYRTDWRPIIMGLATLTLIVGTVAAVVQTDLKRALAYSSIANAGYVLIGFAAAAVDNPEAAHRGLESALFYLFTYTFMTIGAFAVVTLAGRRTHDARHGFDQYRGLAHRSPVLAGFLTFFLLAQAGVPLTGGFVAKLEVFGAAIDAREYWLAIVGVLSSVVLAFFYLRMTVVVFSVDDDAGETVRGPRRRLDAAGIVALIATGVMVLLLGIVPGSFLHFARDAASLI